MTSLKYGLVGAGMMGREHIRNVALLDDVTVAAVADPDDEQRATSAALVGAAPYANHRALIAEDRCDAYIVAAPNDLHHSLILDLLATGRPVLCEKPLGITAAECRDIIARAPDPALVWVAMEYRYMPPVSRLLDEVAAGTVGTPRMIAIREHRFPFLEKVGDWNRFNARTGGTMTEKCCHFWDLMRRALRADPVRVYASAGADVNHAGERYDGRRPDIVDNGFVVVDFANGARGMLDLCMFAEGSYWQETVAVTGERARVEAFVPGPARFSPDGVERTSEIAIADRADRIERREEIEVDASILGAGDHHGSTYYQHRDFARMVREGGAPTVTLDDGLWSVRVGEAAEESARTGRAIDLT